MDSALVLLGIAGLLVGFGFLGIVEAVAAMCSPIDYDKATEIPMLGVGLILTLLGAMMIGQTLASLQP